MRIPMRVLAFVLPLVAGVSSTEAQLALRPAASVSKAGARHFRLAGASDKIDCTKIETKVGWFPTKSDDKNVDDADLAKCFWDLKGQEYLKFGQLVSSAKNMSLATEIVADSFGGVRVALSTAVAATTDSTQPVAGSDEPTSDQDRVLNLLTSNGGNLAVTGSYPFYYKPLGKKKDDGEDSGSFVWNTFVRAAANMSAFGGKNTNSQKFSDVDGNIELAFADIHADLLGHDEKINLLGYLKTSGIIGTGKFAKSLSDNASKAFVHAQVGAGLRVGEVLMIYAGYNWFSDGNIPGRGATLTVVVGK